MARKTKSTIPSWNEGPQTEAEYIALGNELITWVKEESSLAIDEFPISRMIAPSLFHTLPAKSEQFAQAYDIALGIIGLRRERLAHEGAINTHIVRETMPLYDRVYRKWLISDKNKDENAGETKFLIIKMPHFYQCPDGSHEKEANEITAKEELKVQEAMQQESKNPYQNL